MTTYQYGGFWRRTGALIIDKIILYIILTIFGIVALIAMRLSLPPGQVQMIIDGFKDMSGVYVGVYYSATFFVDMVYFTYFHGASGQTPGKMIFGLRVIQTSGRDMTFGIAFLRWVGYLVSAVFIYLGYLWVAFDGRKQGWHDKIAATVVVQTRDEPPRQKAATAPAEPEADEKYLDKDTDVL
ncbi:MAG: RDD family protein [Deltaproteobacteria bacterium]|nr:RDD family protein [Deltaproteobacteria bacterium]